MGKQITYQEFNKIPLSELTKLLFAECKLVIPKGASESHIRDIAQNKLHGISFINDNEEIKNDKIIQKPIIITKNYEKCPNCQQKKMILQPFPKESGLEGAKWCESCSYLVKSGGK